MDYIRMQPKSLNFSSLKIFDTSLDPLHNLPAFCALLLEAGIVEKDNTIKRFSLAANVSDLEIDFSKGGFLGLTEVCILALIIRGLAAKSTRVKIKWPKKLKSGELSSLHRFLERLKFAKLLEDKQSPWTKNITIEGIEPVLLGDKKDVRLQYYVGLNWIDHSCLEKVGDNWWTSPIKFKSDAIEDIKNVLYYQNFVNSEERDILENYIIREICSNIVLHAGEEAGQGFGVLCAHIENVRSSSEKFFHLCISDLGRGIPHSVIRTSEAERIINEAKKVFYTASESTLIIRETIGGRLSGRPAHPSEVDKTSDRGLKLVVEAVKPDSRFYIISCGGGVLLKPTSYEDPKLIEDFQGSPISGVQTFVTLRIPMKRPRPNFSWKDSGFDSYLPVTTVVDANGGIESLLTSESAIKFASTLKFHSSYMIYDLGYADRTRELEYLFSALVGVDRGVIHILWNVSSPISFINRLPQRIKNSLVEKKSIFLFVRNCFELYCVGERNEIDRNSLLKDLIADGSLSALDGSEGVYKGHVNVDVYFRLSKKINQSFLARGFEAHAVQAGFFSGNIHLLNGDIVNNFFSLLPNITLKTANLRRWTIPCLTLIQSILERAKIGTSKIGIIGLTVTLYDILRDLKHLLPENCKFEFFSGLDAPTAEEARIILPDCEKVVLVTDVISQGTHARSVAESLERASKQVIGVISIVDARSNQYAGDDFMEVYSLAAMIVQKKQRSNDMVDYWIDPVTMIPVTSDFFPSEIDKRIFKTISILVKTGSAKINHIITGPRHSSVFFNSQRLIENGGSVLRSAVKREITERLEERGMLKLFNPRIALYVKSNSFGNEIADPSGSGPLLTQLLREELWPELIDAPVLRIFGSDGISRTAKNLTNNDLGSQPKHIVIVDSGMWLGKTAEALIHLAAYHNATHVVVISLIGRMLPVDLMNWEAIKEVQFSVNTTSVNVLHIFPFYLPIPLYTKNECPFDATLSKLQNKQQSIDFPAELFADQINPLLAHSASDSESKGEEYCNTWLSLRLLSQLATDDIKAVESLKIKIKDCESDQSLLALFELYLHEWRLLGQTRLRESCARTVEEKAISTLSAKSLTIPTKLAALSLLRSLFKKTFLKNLSVLIDLLKEHPHYLPRIFFHIASLSDKELRSNEVSDFLNKLAIQRREVWSKFVAIENYNKLSDSFFNLFVRFGWITSRKIEERSNVGINQAASLLLSLLKNEPDIHELQGFLVTYTSSPQERLVRHTSNDFHSHAQEWKEFRKLLSISVIPLIERLRELFLMLGKLESGILPPHISYLTSADSRYILDDMNALSLCLDFLQVKPDSMLIKQVRQVSLNLMDHVVSKGSSLEHSLDSLHHYTVLNAIDLLGKSIKAKLDIVEIEKPPYNPWQPEYLFVPDKVLRNIIQHISTNLIIHAFDSSETKTIHKVRIRIETFSIPESGRKAHFQIQNNGSNLDSIVIHNSTGATYDAEAKSFGGEYLPPKAINDDDFTVQHEFSFLLW